MLMVTVRKRDVVVLFVFCGDEADGFTDEDEDVVSGVMSMRLVMKRSCMESFPF